MLRLKSVQQNGILNEERERKSLDVMWNLDFLCRYELSEGIYFWGWAKMHLDDAISVTIWDASKKFQILLTIYICQPCEFP